MLVDRAVVTTSDVSAWLQWTEKADVQVDNTETTDYHVSTVFLNADLSHGRGEPVCFETMVFCSESYLDRIPDDQSLDRRQYRYATWDEAVAGHAAVVEHLERQMADAISRAVESSGRPR
jgi:hypothetical protein